MWLMMMLLQSIIISDMIWYDLIITGDYNGSIKLWDFGKRINIINIVSAHSDGI